MEAGKRAHQPQRYRAASTAAVLMAHKCATQMRHTKYVTQRARAHSSLGSRRTCGLNCHLRVFARPTCMLICDSTSAGLLWALVVECVLCSNV